MSVLSFQGHACALFQPLHLTDHLAGQHRVVPEAEKVAAKSHSFFRVDRFPFAAECGTADVGVGERLMAAPGPAAYRVPRPLLEAALIHQHPQDDGE